MFDIDVYYFDVDKYLELDKKDDKKFRIKKIFFNNIEICNFIKIKKINRFKSLFIIVEGQMSREKAIEIIDLLHDKGINSILVTKYDKSNFKLQEKKCKTVIIKEKENFNYSLKKVFTVINRDIESIIEEEKEITMRLTAVSTDRKYGRIIGIGASSGGTETSSKIYKKLPANIPPILMVQHMPKVFSKLFTERLDRECSFKVVEAIDGEIIRSNTLYVAPGGYQMSIVDAGKFYKIRIQDIGLVSNHNPSVNHLFKSMARVLRDKCVGVLLTGMGEDGAEGMCEIRNNRGFTIGQDQESSIVYGMPRVAYEKGGVCLQLSDKDIPNYLISNFFKAKTY